MSSKRMIGHFTVMTLGPVFIALLTGCAAPFSDLQSARVAEQGEMEVTGHYSRVFFDGEGLLGGEEMDEVQDHLGLQYETGIGRNKALRLRLERITFNFDDEDEDDSGIYVIAGGPKFGHRAERAALYLPIGFATGDDIKTSKTWQIHPTLIYSHRFGRMLELNLSGKALIPLSCEDCDATFAANVGLAIGAGRLLFRPEMGALTNPGEDGYYKHFSLGVSYRSEER